MIDFALQGLKNLLSIVWFILNLCTLGFIFLTVVVYILMPDVWNVWVEGLKLL